MVRLLPRNGEDPPDDAGCFPVGTLTTSRIREIPVCACSRIDVWPRMTCRQPLPVIVRIVPVCQGWHGQCDAVHCVRTLSHWRVSKRCASPFCALCLLVPGSIWVFPHPSG